MHDKYVEDSAVQRDPLLILSGRRKQFWLGGEELDCTNSTPTLLVNFTECIACR